MQRMTASVGNMNLDNCMSSAQTTVQKTHEMITPNGCRVTMYFPAVGRKGLREEIAGMLLATIVNKQG